MSACTSPATTSSQDTNWKKIIKFIDVGSPVHRKYINFKYFFVKTLFYLSTSIISRRIFNLDRNWTGRKRHLILNNILDEILLGKNVRKLTKLPAPFIFIQLLLQPSPLKSWRRQWFSVALAAVTLLTWVQFLHYYLLLLNKKSNDIS